MGVVGRENPRPRYVKRTWGTRADGPVEILRPKAGLRMTALFPRTASGVGCAVKAAASLQYSKDHRLKPVLQAGSFLFIDFFVELFDFFADLVAVFGFGIEIEIALVGFDGGLFLALFLVALP